MLMPWPATGPQGGDVLGVLVEGAGADGDALVAVGDGGVGDEDVLGVLDVDAVGVGAQRRGANGQDEHAAAAVKLDGAVLHLEALHRHVCHEKPQRLRPDDGYDSRSAKN